MDFGTLLHKAQKNEKSSKNQPVKYYSTKFEPPKKEQRTKQLSENIKKFLAKKEAEERGKREEANRRREELLALRAKDKKATRRVNVMLKRTKSANQSAIEDAIDQDSTSVTAQPDEDDYGYVSQEAAAYYNKMMEKYSKMPQDEPKFPNRRKPIHSNLNTTKVKRAVEEKRQKKSEMRQEEEKPPIKVKRKNPPPINFADLLKIAEKKQFEPIIIEPKVKEEEKPLTNKQKKELEREKEWRDRKEGRLPPLPINNPTSSKLNSNKQKVNGTKNVGQKAIDPKRAKKAEKTDKPPMKTVPLNSDKPAKGPIRKPEKPREEFRQNIKIAERKPMKRMIINDDEDEYDSELDDFIDDGPQNEDDYSRHIKEIFGYDKSKYRNAVEEEDDNNMESTFAQQMREEVISAKIGRMEDLEDMEKEEEEKKRKALMRKKMKY